VKHRDDFWSVLSPIVLVAVITLLGAAGMFWWDARRCGQHADELGLGHRYEVVAGCSIELVDGVYVPLGDLDP
jgi:hypothetical protein